MYTESETLIETGVEEGIEWTANESKTWSSSGLAALTGSDSERTYLVLRSRIFQEALEGKEPSAPQAKNLSEEEVEYRIFDNIFSILIIRSVYTSNISFPVP